MDLIQLRKNLPVRLHFAILLLTFGELVAWQDASQHGILDWLAIALLYVAMSAILLDVMVRWRANDWRSLLLVAGLFGAMRAAMMSVLVLDADTFAVDLVFLPFGVEALMFVLAFLSFRLLLRGDTTGIWAFGIAAALGLFWGVWTRWGTTLDTVNVIAPDWSESLPYVVIMLLLGGIFPLLLRPSMRMEAEDWKLTPYGWGLAGVIVWGALILRASQGHIDAGSLIAVLLVSVALGFILAFTTSLRRDDALSSITPPHVPLILGWLVLLIPFAVLAWVGYNLSDGQDTPIYAEGLFRAILGFGLLWLPIVSTWEGTRLLIRLTREGY